MATARFFKAVQLVTRINFYFIALAVKFLLLISYGLVFPGAEDVFGQYSLALGLTATFFIFSGMRGRIFILQGVKGRRDFRKFSALIIALGAIALLAIGALNVGNQYLHVILLVGIVKYFETILEANTSFIQSTVDRDLSFRILSFLSIAIIAVFGLALYTLGLRVALLLESLCLLLTIAYQRLFAFPPTSAEAAGQGKGLRSLLAGSLALTLVATLNSAIAMVFLYWGSSALAESDLFIIAKFLTLQAFIVRIVTNFSIYFTKRIAKDRFVLAKWSVMLSIFGFVVCVASLLLPPFELPFVSNGQLAVLAMGFTIVNSANIAVRQQLLIFGVVRQLTYLHLFELIVFTLVCFVLQPSTWWAFFAFTFLRFFRIFQIANILRSIEFEQDDRKAT